MKKRFFEERTDQSEVKARIVQKYFETWAKVIMPTAAKYGNKIAYIDLYAGPGRYKDGAASTPLLVLERAIADPKISKMLVALFNDRDADCSSTLRQEIDSLPGIEKLTYRPQVLNNEVDVDAERYFRAQNCFLRSHSSIPSGTRVYRCASYTELSKPGDRTAYSSSTTTALMPDSRTKPLMGTLMPSSAKIVPTTSDDESKARRPTNVKL